MVSSIARRKLQAYPHGPGIAPDPAWCEVMASCGLGSWLGALALLGRIDSLGYGWVVRASDLGSAAPAWNEFSSWIVEEGGAEWSHLLPRPTLVMTEDLAVNALALVNAEPGAS